MLEFLFNKVASLKKRVQHRYFLVNIPKLLGAAFLIEHLRWLLLMTMVTVRLMKGNPMNLSSMNTIFLGKHISHF